MGQRCSLPLKPDPLGGGLRQRDLFLFLVTSLAVATGCTPWPTLVQPGIDFHVVGRDGTPIPGATVTLARYSVSMSPDELLVERSTSPTGEASFASERRWQLIVFAPDGLATFYSWSWCAEAAGYAATYANDLRTSGHSPSQAIVLEASAEQSTCAWSCAPCHFATADAL